MTHVTCRLTAKNRDQLRNPTLGNRVWATFLGHRRPKANSVTAQEGWLGLRINDHQMNNDCVMITTTQQPPFYGHYTGQPALAGTSS